MAKKPRWTYGHAWLTWQILRRSRPMWGRGFEPMFPADHTARWPSPGGRSVSMSAGAYPEPTDKGHCPPGHARLGRELCASMEPDESHSVRIEGDAPSGTAPGRVLVSIDLEANEEEMIAVLRRRLRGVRTARRIRQRARLRGGGGARAIWGILGPALAYSYWSHVRADGGTFESWYEQHWRRLNAIPVLGKQAREADSIRSKSALRDAANRAKRAIDKAIKTDPWAAYRYL